MVISGNHQLGTEPRLFRPAGRVEFSPEYLSLKIYHSSALPADSISAASKSFMQSSRSFMNSGSFEAFSISFASISFLSRTVYSSSLTPALTEGMRSYSTYRFSSSNNSAGRENVAFFNFFDTESPPYDLLYKYIVKKYV